MTVSSTSSRIVYAGNGTTTVFPFAFKVQQPADLVVVYTDATGTDFTLSPGQYTAGGFGLDAGGSVTYPTSGSAIAAGTTLTIYRDVAPTQPTSISNQGAMWPQVIEAALDRLTFIAQKITDTASRALVIAPTDGGSLAALPTAVQRANSVLGFDASGQPVPVSGLGTTSVTSWLAANFLTMTSRLAALGALGGAGTADNNTLSGTNDFTAGRIKVPTRAAGDNGTDAASTAFVQGAMTGTSGQVVQRVYVENTTFTNTGGATIPSDNTIPQITEGSQFLSATIMPKSMTNRVRVRVLASLCATSSDSGTLALFRNGGTSAIDAVGFRSDGIWPSPVPIEFEDVPGATSMQSYTVRAGFNSGGACVNGISSARAYGGAMRSFIILEEVVP